MSSPHVAEALALLASVNKPGNAAQVQALYNTLKANGSSAWTDDSGDGFKEPLLDLLNVNVFAPRMIAGAGTARQHPIRPPRCKSPARRAGPRSSPEPG